MNEAVQAAINDQIKHEFDSAYFYLQESAYFESINQEGFAHWMRVQAKEEVAHAMKFFDFLVDRGARVTLRGLDQPHSDFASPLDAFSRALQHEQDVTAKINKLYGLAVAQSDYPAQVLLQWFITEQVEEEKNATRIVEELKMVGGNTSALLLLNRELGARQPESAQTGESA